MRNLSMPNSAAGKIARYSLYATLGTWFAATVASQDPWRKFEKLRAMDKTSIIIPEWRFFAPRPGMHDNHLLVRDELPDGGFTPWKETCAVVERKWFHFLWYPGRRGEKVITDCVGELQTMQPHILANRDSLQVSTTYLTLLNYIINQVPHHPETKGVQFMLANSAGYDKSEKPSILFTSNIHPLT